MKKLYLLLATMLAISASVCAQQGTVVRNIYGSGTPSGTLAQAVGTTYVDQSTSPATTYTCTSVAVSICTWTSIGSTSSVSTTTRTINAADAAYGLPATGFYSCVANYSNASTTLTTDATTDTPFTAAMVGWSIFATNGPCQGTNGSFNGTVHFNGTISAFNNANSVTLSGTPSGTCAGSQAGGVSCRAYWVPSDSAVALNAAWAAATAKRSTCALLVLPAGVYKFNTAIVTTTACGVIASLATGTADNGPSVRGQSMSSTILVADPTFNANTCANIAGGGCVFALGPNIAQSISISELTITGGGNSVVTNGNGRCKISSFSWPSTAENLLLDYWGHNTPGFVGICWGGTNQGQSIIKNVNVYNGGYSCASLTGFVSVYQLFCFTPTGSTIAGNGNYTFGSSFFNGAGVNVTLANGGCQVGTPMWVSDGDQLTTQGNNGNIGNATACPIYLNNDSIIATNLVNINLGGGQAHVARSYMKSISGTNIGSFASGSVFYDEGGNTFSGTNVLTNLTWIADGHQVKGNCTGVATAASTLGLYGTGSNVILGTCTSAAIGLGVPVVGARTLQNLIVSATAAGTNASSGVVTVLKNGVATTITCTIGTATSCLDGSHTVALVDGDRVSIQFTSQAADTLAGVSASVAWF